MIVGSGIDIIETSRMQRELASCPWSADDGVFTQREICFCNTAIHSARLYAACFAAKEATFKALGVELPNLSLFREIELLPDDNGDFTLKVHGRTETVCRERGVRRLCVAVTTTARLSGAVVVLES